MEQIKGDKLVQDNDGSMDTPLHINNAKSKAVKKVNDKITIEEVTVSPTIIHQNSLQASIEGWKYARRYDFWLTAERTTDNPETAI